MTKLHARIKLLSLFLIVNAAVWFVSIVSAGERTVTKLAEGVYVIIHPDAPTGFPNSNTTVIIGDREVFVVDACYLPSAARRDIEQIKQWTNKPVRYLLNTHWHYDHTWGNSTYAEAFPSIGIIAHKVTREEMEGFNPEWLVRYPKETEELRQKLGTGKGDDGKPLTDAEKTAMKEDIAAREQVSAEFKNFVDRLPNITFDSELNIDIGNREVQVKYLGHGNTAGDAIVFLPKERIVITGDILVHPTPYTGSGYPSEWIVTLQRIVNLDPQAIVPGHGEVQHDRIYLNQVVSLLTLTVSEVRKALYRLGNMATLEDVQKVIDLAVFRQQFAGGDKDKGDLFDRLSPRFRRLLLRSAYYEVRQR